MFSWCLYFCKSKREKNIWSLQQRHKIFFRKCWVQAEVVTLTLASWTHLPDPVPYFLTQTSSLPKQLTSSTSSSSRFLLFPNIHFCAQLPTLVLDFFYFTAPVNTLYYIVSTEQWIGAGHLLNRYFCLHLGTLVLLLQIEGVNEKNPSFAIPSVSSLSQNLLLMMCLLAAPSTVCFILYFLQFSKEMNCMQTAQHRYRYLTCLTNIHAGAVLFVTVPLRWWQLHSLVQNKACKVHTMKACGRSWAIAPVILFLDTGWIWVANLMPRPFYP